MESRFGADVVVVYFTAIFAVALLGNLTTIIVIAAYRPLQSTNNFYILNLAVADLLRCIATLTTKNMLHFHHRYLFCAIDTFLSVFFFMASVLAILLIAIDRWCFICKPLYYRTHPITTKINYLIVTSWVLSFLLALVPFTVWGLAAAGQHSLHGTCTYRSVFPAWYLMALVILTELFPPIVFCLVYSRIVTVARRHALEIAIQFNNTKTLEMDWLERRRFTETLVSPFSHRLSSPGRPVTADCDKSMQIRAILYRNYDSWMQKRREELLLRSQQENDVEDEVFEELDQGKNLTKVGKSLREWKRRATSMERSIMESWDERDREVIEKECQKNRAWKNKITPSSAQDDRAKYRTREATRTKSAPVQSKSPNVDRAFPLRRLLSLNKMGQNRINEEGVVAPEKRNISILTSLSKFSMMKKRKQGSAKVKVKKEFRAVRMLGMVVGMFVLLHVPIAFLDIINIARPTLQLPPWTWKVALCLTLSSPAVDPLIYVIIKRQFRFAFLRLWSCGHIDRRVREC